MDRGIAWVNGSGQSAPQADQAHRAAEPAVAGRPAVAELGREHDDLCSQACDPLEIAAVLEARGFSDSRARHGFRVNDVFEVAELLWGTVPWRAADRPVQDERWQLPAWRALLRGLLYLLPAVLYLLALSETPSGRVVGVLLVFGVVSIALGQGVSLLGHILLGRGQQPLLRRLLSRATVLAVGLGLAGMWWTHAIDPGTHLGFVAAGQLVYMVAATVLIVRRDDLRLLAVLGPGVGVAFALRAGVGTTSPLLLDAFMAGVVAVTVLLAWWRTRAPGFHRLRLTVGRQELRATAIACLYGAGLAGLAAFVVVDAVTGRIQASGAYIALVMMPVTLSLGLADYLLHRARHRTLSWLASSDGLDRFARAARTELNVMLLLHAGAVAVLTAAIAALAGGTPTLALHAWTYAVMSVALLVLTLLLSLGYFALTAWLICAAAAADLAVRALTPLHGQALGLAHLAVVCALLLVGYRMTGDRFVRPTVHA